MFSNGLSPIVLSTLVLGALGCATHAKRLEHYRAQRLTDLDRLCGPVGSLVVRVAPASTGEPAELLPAPVAAPPE